MAGGIVVGLAVALSIGTMSIPLKPEPERPAIVKQVEPIPKVVNERPKQRNTPPKDTRATASVSFDVQATFYTAYCNTGCTGVTATGVDVSRGTTFDGMRIIAVDPNIIPLWSIVDVKLSGGESFRAIALDTGGAIRGNIIDVLVSDSATAQQNGRQSATITIIRKGK